MKKRDRGSTYLYQWQSTRFGQFWSKCLKFRACWLCVSCIQPNVLCPVYASCLCKNELEVEAQCVAPIMWVAPHAQCTTPSDLERYSPIFPCSTPKQFCFAFSLNLECKWALNIWRHDLYMELLNFNFAKPTFIMFWKWLYFQTLFFGLFHFIWVLWWIKWPELCLFCRCWNYWG